MRTAPLGFYRLPMAASLHTAALETNFQLYFGGTKTMTNDHPEAGLESAVILWFLRLGEGSHIYVKHSAKQIGWL